MSYIIATSVSQDSSGVIFPCCSPARMLSVSNLFHGSTYSKIEVYKRRQMFLCKYIQLLKVLYSAFTVTGDLSFSSGSWHGVVA